MSEITVIKKGERVALDPRHSSFAHGFGIFETMRFQNGCLRFWEDHWARLMSSAQRLKMPIEVGASEVLAAIESLLRDNPEAETVVKISLIREGSGSHLYVYTRPVFPPPEKVRLLLDDRYPVNEHSPLVGHKTHNYMENWYLLEQVRAAGFFDRIRLNTAGQLAETCIANLFFMVDGSLHTPALAAGVLPGIMRSAICQCVEVKTGLYPSAILERAEAIFLSNVSFDLLPVNSVERAGSAPKLFSGLTDQTFSLQTKVDALARCRGVKIF